MSQQLDVKQYVPLSGDERQVLRHEAASRGISTGLLARVLLMHGLEHIADAVMGTRVDEELVASRERIEKGARLAVNARWSAQEAGDDSP